MNEQIRRWVLTLLTVVLVSPCQMLAQAGSPPSQPVKEWSLPAGIITVEGVAFGSAALARSETGARVVGTIEGVSGVAALSIAGFSDRKSGRPGFMVPYGIGLLGLAYYNFASAASARREQRFWTNAIGFNVAVLAGVLSGVILERHEHNLSAVSMHVSPSAMFVRIPF